MGPQPIAERMGDNRTYPLVLRECGSCHLVQLGYAVHPGELFPPDHPYATGNTAVLREHYMLLAREVHLAAGLRTGDVVAEIGANDGTLLSWFGPGLTRVAVEPTDQAEKAPSPVIVLKEFFTPDTAAKIVGHVGPAKVVLANNVLAHVPDPHAAVEGIWKLLDDDGILVSENHDVHQVLTGQIDTIYHEHLRYYSPATFARLLADCGLEAYKVEPVDTHGGSFRTWARKRRSALDAMPAAAKALNAMLQSRTHGGQLVYGIGATTRAVPLIHYAGIAGYIDRVCEVSGSEKIGRTMPGTDIPVVDEKVLFAQQPEYALLLSWHLADHLIPKLRERGFKGKFIIPLPEPKVV